jgi:hypothetical protein
MASTTKERRKHERVFEYQRGSALATVQTDWIKGQYRVEIRDNKALVFEKAYPDKATAIKAARDSVNYMCKRGE